MKAAAQKVKTTTSRTTTKKTSSAIQQLPANPFAFEVLELVSKQRTNEKKVEVLKKYEHDSLKSIFIWNFDETIISLLPTGDVPYSSVDKQNSFSGTLSDKIDDAVVKMNELSSHSLGTASEVGQQKTALRKEYAKLYNFVKGGNDSLASLRRETMFINLLEGLHPLEAEILILVKDKKLQSRYKISKEVVSQAYPDIVWGNRG
jgi:hypothetical protein